MTSILAGSTNVSLYVYFVDDDGGTAPGEPTTGLLFSNIETGGSASYMRQGAARTDFTLITLASASAAHSDGGFILVDDTNMPGLYRVDVPDAAFAAGVDFVVIQLVAAAANNALMRPLLVDLRPVNPAVDVAQWDGTNVAAPTVAGVPEVDMTHLGGVAQSAADLKDFADEGYDPATNKVQGVVLVDTVTTYTGNTLQTGDSFARLAAPAGASVSADIAAIKAETALIVADTNELQTDDVPALIAGLNNIAAGDVWAVDATTQQTQGTFGQAIGDPVADADTIYGAVVTGAAGANIAADIVAVKAETALIVADTNELQSDDVPTLIAAVQADTDDIQTRLPAALVSGKMDSDMTSIAGVAASATKLERGAKALVTGAAVGTPTTTVIDTDLTEATTDHYKTRIITFTTGAIAGQATDITAYNGTSKELTVTALTDAPSAGDEFVIS